MKTATPRTSNTGSRCPNTSKNTADLSEGFAIDGLKGSARLMGLLHDIGKYQPSFQKRLRGAPIQVDHAVCGAKDVAAAFGRKQILGNIFAYGIIGHHSGLPDIGHIGENDDESSLRARMKKSLRKLLRV